MIKNSLLSFLLLVSFYTFGQINAITESGDEVILYDDGSWVYVADSSTHLTETVKMNEKVFKAPKSSTFLVKSKKTDVGVKINPKIWKFTKGEPGQPAEFVFQNKTEDMYGMIITEKISIDIKALKQIALSNAKSAAPDIKLINQEYRMVNGAKVLMMEMRGTIQGVKFVYYGYYYSDDTGSVQFLTYTSQNLFEEYKKEMEKLLNGFVVLKK